MVKSIQSQHSGDENNQLKLLSNMYHVIEQFDTPLHPYKADSRIRDSELLMFSRSEPLIAGVLSSVVQRDINRSWMLTGSAAKVKKTARALHSVNNQKGWRDFISRLSTSYYSTNVGFSAEIGTDLRGKPLTMWSFDPTTIVLDEGSEFNLIYYPTRHSGKKSTLSSHEFIHGNSMPSVEEDMNGVGFCSVERSLMMVRIAIGLFQYQLEKLGVAPPKGLVLFKGFDKDDYNQAIADAEQELSENEIHFFKNIVSIFTNQLAAEVEMIGFSQLPESFVLKDFIDIIMQTYALAFGYPVSEVWSISTGSFSSDGEMAVQQEQATEKGELAFSLSLQEQIQTHFVPSSVLFSFDIRNDSGDLQKIQIEREQIAKILSLYNAGRFGQAKSEKPEMGSDKKKPNDIDKEKDEEEKRYREEISEGEDEEAKPLLNRKQALEMLVQAGVIPSSYTEGEDNSENLDIKMIRDQARQNPYIINRALNFPDEPIVQYNWNPIDDAIGGVFVDNDSSDYILSRYLSESPTPSGRYKLLYESGEDMLRKRNF